MLIPASTSQFLKFIKQPVEDSAPLPATTTPQCGRYSDDHTFQNKYLKGFTGLLVLPNIYSPISTFKTG
jgi:hypothetical protein